LKKNHLPSSEFQRENQKKLGVGGKKEKNTEMRKNEHKPRRDKMEKNEDLVQKLQAARKKKESEKAQAINQPTAKYQ